MKNEVKFIIHKTLEIEVQFVTNYHWLEWKYFLRIGMENNLPKLDYSVYVVVVIESLRYQMRVVSNISTSYGNGVLKMAEDVLKGGDEMQP
ncbi:hypothetical protein BLOT_013174 [Blomia tropicalis]|nr:hypothetical protein BLOT_013174 [Blomia tropicalis]